MITDVEKDDEMKKVVVCVTLTKTYSDFVYTTILNPFLLAGHNFDLQLLIYTLILIIIN